MSKVSIYTQSLRKLVDKNKIIIPENIYSDDKKTLADWGEPIWYMLDAKSKIHERFMFCQCDLYSNDKSPLKPILSKEYTFLLQIYFINKVVNRNITVDHMQSLIRTARQLLTIAELYDDLTCLSKTDYEKLSAKPGLLDFWRFCKDNKLLSGAKPKATDGRDRYGSTRIEQKKEKFKQTPLSTITAIAEIYHEVFKHVNEDGTVIEGKEVKLKDALPISFAIFGLATPSRLSSEVPYLVDQKIKSSKTKNGKETYYLDWPGSKNYQDNKTHVLAVMAPIIKKIVNFYSVQFKPNRYFVRFLKNPSGSWSDLLKGFNIEPERKANIDFKKNPNLFTFAYAIGYYPIDFEIEVLKDSDLVIEGPKVRDNFRLENKLARSRIPKSKRLTGLRIKNSDFYTSKCIGLLDSNDLVKLHGYKNQRAAILGLAYGQSMKILSDSYNWDELIYIKRHVTVDSFSKVVIDAAKNLFPNFPYTANNQNKKKIDLENALFCINPKYKNNFKADGMCGSVFNILSASKLNSVFNKNFKDIKYSSSGYPRKTKNAYNIFEAYGYGRITLQPHSLRHFSNTLLEQSEIPIEVIAAFSGRKSIKQTLEYVHTPEDEKAERLISTLELHGDEKDIRIISQQTLETVGGYPASVTDTGVCIQELSAYPCEYLNDFMNGCYGCQSACYICQDAGAIKLFEKDLEIQQDRIKTIESEKKYTFSDAAKNWFVIHTQAVYALEKLIHILKTYDIGLLVRLSQDNETIYITDTKTGEVEEFKVLLPQEKEILETLKINPVKPLSPIPQGMLEIIQSEEVKRNG